MENHHVLFSLGSNLDDRVANINNAIELLSINCNFSKDNISSFYETEPYGNGSQNWFVNIALFATTSLSPINLLFFCKSIEYSLGRKKTPIWSERIIDIDILMFDNLIMKTTLLTIPHNYFHKRKFVLIPSNEIASRLTHPQINKTIKELLEICDDECIVRKFSNNNAI